LAGLRISSSAPSRLTEVHRNDNRITTQSGARHRRDRGHGRDERQRFGALAWRLLGMRGVRCRAIAGAALSSPYVAPRYYYGGPVVAPGYAYPLCPLVGPAPYYGRY
jgi:hypothetical protein